jgi:hypothetical protein
VVQTTPSRKQAQVLDAIRQLPGCSGATSEHKTDDGLFSIDIAVQLPGNQKLAVEADGPTHFLSNGQPDGATRLRNRLLQARGWRVVSVPVTEWYWACAADVRSINLLTSCPKGENIRCFRKKIACETCENMWKSVKSVKVFTLSGCKELIQNPENDITG